MIDISKITDYLYVGSCVRQEHAEELRVLKFDLIISMIAQLKIDEIYTKPPFKSLWIRTYDTFFTPISIRKLLQGVEAAKPIIEKGGKVLVFCVQGKRRSVAMAASILMSLGYTLDDASKLLIASREVANPQMWYIKRQLKRFEAFWLRYHKKEVT